MDRVPKDVLLQIVVRFDPQTLVDFARSCKRHYSLSQSLFSKIYISREIKRRALKDLERMTSRIRSSDEVTYLTLGRNEPSFIWNILRISEYTDILYQRERVQTEISKDEYGGWFIGAAYRWFPSTGWRRDEWIQVYDPETDTWIDCRNDPLVVGKKVYLLSFAP